MNPDEVRHSVFQLNKQSELRTFITLSQSTNFLLCGPLDARSKKNVILF